VETLPPTHPQRPTSDSDAAADKHNASILAVRGLHTTATGHELYRLAWSACQNIGVPSTTEAESRTPHGSSPGPGRPFEVAFEPFYFFFYGSLQIPSVLRAVCGITSSEEGIDLGAEASITGWRLRKWGPVSNYLGIVIPFLS
jgi:hypothetical protein